MTDNPPKTTGAETAGEPDAAAATSRLVLGLAGLMTLIASLAVLPPFWEPLWMPGIGVTEWGHWLVLLTMLLALGVRRDGRGRLLAGLIVASLGMLLTPLAVSNAASDDIAAAVAAFADVPPYEAPGAPARAAPLTPRGLLGAATPGVTVRRETYGKRGEQALVFDLYQRPELGDEQPLVVAIHGGSWRHGDPTQLAEIYRYLAARGVSVASVSYRLAPEHAFPAARDDVALALAALRERAGELGLRAGPPVVYGRSAGGHLALLMAVTRPTEVAGAIALYAPTDLIWSWEHPANPWLYDSPTTLRLFLLGSPAEAPASYELASPARLVKGWRGAPPPPVMLIHGQRDGLVNPRHSREMAKALEAVGGRVGLIELPWGMHGCEANLAGPSGQLTVYAVERAVAAMLRGGGNERR